MAFTTFTGPVRSGTVRQGPSRNTGLVVLSQSAAIPAAAGATTVGILPAGSIIIAQFFSTTTVFNVATTATVGDGTSPSLFSAATNTVTAVGTYTLNPTTTGQNVGTADTPVVVTTVGSAATGAATYTVVYAQRLADGTAQQATS